MTRINLEINDVLFEKLTKSLKIQDETLEQAFSKFAESYIISTYQKLSKYLDELKLVNIESQDESSLYDYKGVRRIKSWARKSSQYNHKIIKAFLQLEKERNVVRLSDLQERCNDKENHPEVYVPTFSSNFAQMKFDEGNSHGKIFEESFGVVTIWKNAKNELEAYKHFFE